MEGRQWQSCLKYQRMSMGQKQDAGVARMKLLAIDCSSENISLCVASGDTLILNFNRRVRFGASRLVTYLQRALQKLSIRLRDFDALVVGAGPGSFTGLRISFSVIKALALATKLPVISVESFFACAYPLRNRSSAITVISDARRNLLYYARFHSR